MASTEPEEMISYDDHCAEIERLYEQAGRALKSGCPRTAAELHRRIVFIPFWSEGLRDWRHEWPLKEQKEREDAARRNRH